MYFNFTNLQLYLGRGLKLKNIHCVSEFNQSQWLKPYIDSTHAPKKWRQRWKSVAQINEQFYIQKNNGKLKK